jgi:FdhD protein
MNDVNEESFEIIRFNGKEGIRVEEEIVCEFPLTIILNGEEFATMVCSPTNLKELVIGFLASEGIIRLYEEIKTIAIDETMGFAYVEIYREIDKANMDHSKRIIGSCCGKSRQFYFRSDVKTAKTITNRLFISVEECYNLMKELQLRSEQFRRTGGVHNAALATPDGLIEVRSDIGRHNALDKLYGTVLEQKIPLKDKIIVFSGRISSEVLLKVSKIGIGILLSKSAPTDLALNLANELGITAIGFARENKMNVYTHPHRIVEVDMESYTK